MSEIIGIMACDENGGIGYRNLMPWHIPSESEHFYNEVQSSPMIMGSKTLRSMPFHKINANSIIISNTISDNDDFQKKGISIFDSVTKIRSNLTQDRYYMIGGKQLLLSMIHELDRFILTIIQHQYECDLFLDLKIFERWHWTHLLKHQDGYNIYSIEPFNNSGEV